MRLPSSYFDVSIKESHGKNLRRDIGDRYVPNMANPLLLIACFMRSSCGLIQAYRRYRCFYCYLNIFRLRHGSPAFSKAEGHTRFCVVRGPLEYK